jgi:hypothetical protein
MKFDEALHAAGAGEVVFLAAALVDQADAHAVVQEAQLAQALAQDLVVELAVLLEDLGVGQEVHLGAALLGVAGDAHRRDLDALHLFDDAVLHEAAAELQLVLPAVAPHRQAQLSWTARSRSSRPRRAGRPRPCSCSG